MIRSGLKPFDAIEELLEELPVHAEQLFHNDANKGGTSSLLGSRPS